MVLVELLTKDGVIMILCEKDEYGCVKTVMSLNGGEPWAEIFAEMEEFKEFIESLSVIQGIRYQNNQKKIA